MNLMMNTAYIGLGSNKGDRQRYIREAVKSIGNNTHCRVVKVSSMYETLPFGDVEQDNFYNAVIKIETDLDIHGLLILVKDMEADLGRTASVRWGPREIDADILLFNNIVYSDEKINIPHKGISERAFVLAPLCEIEPELIHPGLNIKMCTLLNKEKLKDIIHKSELNINK